MSIMKIETPITDLRSYLRKTGLEVFRIRTSIVDGGGWDNVQSTAYSAGFKVYRLQDSEYAARREFADCYQFERVATPKAAAPNAKDAAQAAVLEALPGVKEAMNVQRLIFRKSNADLLDLWDLVDSLDVTPEIATVRGWLMAEMEKRWPAEYDRWFDDESPASSIRPYL